VLGPEHPNTLSSINNLALLYADQGKYEQASRFNKRALATCERVLGLSTPNTLSSINNLALLYADQGKGRTSRAALPAGAGDPRARARPEHPTP